MREVGVASLVQYRDAMEQQEESWRLVEECARDGSWWSDTRWVGRTNEPETGDDAHRDAGDNWTPELRYEDEDGW